MENQKALLDIQDVSINYHTKRGKLEAVHQANFSIGHRTSVAVIGESGCGKTTLATSIVQMLSRNASISEGSIWFSPKGSERRNLVALTEDQMRTLRWNNIVMMFQASQSSFNPVTKIYTQFLDTAKAHENPFEPDKVIERAKKLLELVYLDSETVLNAYPHELSGGMKQRTLIALSLLLNPQLVILDEPTTALDLITQKKILRLLNELRSTQGFSMMFITHDLGIVTQLSDRVVTMYAGTVVENAPTKEFFADPKHPYSKGLLKAIPSLEASFEQLYSIPGTTPDLVEKMQGCLFAPRCELCHQRCKTEVPRLKLVGKDRWAACHAIEEDKNGTH